MGFGLLTTDESKFVPKLGTLSEGQILSGVDDVDPLLFMLICLDCILQFDIL